MSDIHIRQEGKAGRITLTRPSALNALSYDMCLKIDAALIQWADDDAVVLIVIDAEGDKAFSAGGDITELYEAGTKGDYAYGQTFWRDEYRMNARLHNYLRNTCKPVISFMQGFTMGGGMGVGCHGSHRIVGESSRIAMPECAIGLVPDVGSSLILGNAPGHLGEFIGLTGYRMGPADAIHVGFADTFVPEAAWTDLKEALVSTGSTDAIAKYARSDQTGALTAHMEVIDQIFAGDTLADIQSGLAASGDDFLAQPAKSISRSSPLALACALQIIRSVRSAPSITNALQTEYRYTYRASQHSDFLEGIRAAVIDKDRNPVWQYGIDQVTPARIETMLAPLGENELTF